MVDVLDRERALARAREVLRLEAAALEGLAGSVGDGFLAACRMVLDCTGRVVVSGMGKAGLVGQKVSATLASTGTPSLFLHPAEALHGDLGRMRREDVLLALSKSGRTEELVRLVPAVRSIGARIVAFTADADSPLGRHADVVVAIGDAPEACPLGLAPTVSTTAMLALGDALAMAVLEGRDFTREEFARNHPAGSLGRALMRVGEIMRRGEAVPLLPSGATLRDAVAVMTSTPGRPGAAIVVGDGDRLLGIFTDGDLRRLVAAGELPLDEAVDAFMAREPRRVREDQLVGEVLRTVRDTHVDQLPVVAADGDAVVGLIDVQDLLEAAP